MRDGRANRRLSYINWLLWYNSMVFCAVKIKLWNLELSYFFGGFIRTFFYILLQASSLMFGFSSANIAMKTFSCWANYAILYRIRTTIFCTSSGGCFTDEVALKVSLAPEATYGFAFISNHIGILHPWQSLLMLSDFFGWTDETYNLRIRFPVVSHLAYLSSLMNAF